MKVGVVIPAAGSGNRMGGPKMLLDVGETNRQITVLQATLQAFLGLKNQVQIVVSSRANDIETVASYSSKIKVIVGGATRAESVKNGFYALDTDTELVLIHDGARCCVSSDLIYKIIDGGTSYGAVSAGVRSIDTLKIVNNEQIVTETLNRELVWNIQTPQAFKRDILKECYKNFYNPDATDEASMVEKFHPVRLVEGDRENIKVTTTFDLTLARLILNSRK